MTNKQFIKTALLTTGIMSAMAAGIAPVRVRAQIAVIQPFEAVMIEEMVPRQDQPPTPVTRFQRIAVRSDGSISRVYKWDVRLPGRVTYSREVIDATTKNHVHVEDTTKTVVNEAYDDIQVLKPGVLCEGKPSDQIEGFDTVYSEHPMETTLIDTVVIHKKWNAPQLGCYPIIQEWVGKIHGQRLETKQTLTVIRLGEPDAWYFDVPADYTRRTKQEWEDLMKPLELQ